MKKLREEGGEHQHLPSKIFCLRVPKNSVGESFTVALIWAAEKVWIRGGGEFQGSPSKTFRLTVPKISVGESFTVALLSCIEKVWIRGGDYQGFPSKFFLSHSAERLRGGSFLLHYFHYLQCLDKRGREIQILRRNTFFSQCRKFT